MYTITIDKLMLYGYHGVHKEEAIVGGKFELSVSVSYNPVQQPITLDDTINYVQIVELIKVIFATPQLLLETLALQILNEIYTLHNQIKSINVSIQKLNAPIHNFSGHVGCTLYKAY